MYVDVILRQILIESQFGADVLQITCVCEISKMLKACWDCIAGNIKESDNGDVYGTQLNGNIQRSPPWPEPQDENEIMFLLPRKLRDNDRINITGILRENARTMTVNLITGDTTPDYQNIAISVEVIFPNGGNEDQVHFKRIQNGVPEVITDCESTANFESSDNGQFNLSFVVSLREIPIIEVIVDEISLLCQTQIKHNFESIRFLSLNGDVERVTALDFKFS